MSISPPSDPMYSTVYSDWVRASDTDAVAAAEDLVAYLAKGFQGADTPGGFIDKVVDRRVTMLPEAHRPWVWDMVGHWFTAYIPLAAWESRCRKAASSAYGRARAAERNHSLPVPVDYHRANTMLFARAGALPVKEVAVHQKWLAEVMPPAAAHEEFVRLLVASARGGGPLGADWHRRLRSSAKAAGLTVDEDARVLAMMFGACPGNVPDGLLDAAAKVFAKSRPDDGAGLLDLFPTTDTDGAALLRMLHAAGVVDAMADGTLTPPRGLAGWVSHFYYMYCYVKAQYGGIMQQRMPAELFDLVGRVGPRLRESGEPVKMSEGRYCRPYLDADLADAVVAAGGSIEDADRQTLYYWGDRSQRDLVALAADPVLGPRLEAVVHADRGDAGTAITRLPGNPGIVRHVRVRVDAVLERIAGGGLLDAELAVAELDRLLDRPSALALPGIAEVMAELDGVQPLLRTLRAGIPSEFVWPAMESAVAELVDVQGVTSTWPMLTLYNTDRAIVIDPHGRVADTAFELPAGTVSHVVYYAGGDFLVCYSTSIMTPDTAYWASAPEEIFVPSEKRINSCRYPFSGALGYQFATADGRHDGSRVMRPGDRHGIGERQMQLSDGVRIWSAPGYPPDSWSEVTSNMGDRGETDYLPEFFTDAHVPEGRTLAWTLLSYAPLPPDVTTSPLGSKDGMVGYRVTQSAERWCGYELEGIDGRRARFAGGRGAGEPWGVVRMPERSTPDLVLAHGWPGPGRVGVTELMRAFDGESPLWEVRAFPNSDKRTQVDPQNRPMFPPPAFWHFLTPRDPAGSRVLRDIDIAGVRELLATGNPPCGITDPVLAAALRELADRTARLVRERERISARVTGEAIVLPHSR